MVSETDSNSSSSEQKMRDKLHKKIQIKTGKKSKNKKKRLKEKKRSRKETETRDATIQNQKPKSSPKMPMEDDIPDDAFGPALPPHLLNRNNDIFKAESLVIGPKIPQELSKNLEQTSYTHNLSLELQDCSKLESEEENLQGIYGPLPITSEREMSTTQLKLEQRALHLKIAAVDGISATPNEHNIREEWMLELPEVGLKTGLAALNNLKRTFHQGKEKPDLTDRSSWTKTPLTNNEKQNPASSKTCLKELELQAQALYEKQRDNEQETIAKKYKKKHKRKESLVDLHQKKIRKEEKKKAKKLKESGIKPERRPFTRDVDLKLNKIDRNQTKQIVDKAKILNTKFASGHSKYL